MPMIGGGEPAYSVPVMPYSACRAVPAPRMLPVCGKPGIGTASALKVTVGSAEAMPGSARNARPRTARQVDALRISFPSSFDGQIRLDPGNSGAMPVRLHRDPRRGAAGNGATLTRTLLSATGGVNREGAVCGTDTAADTRLRRIPDAREEGQGC